MIALKNQYLFFTISLAALIWMFFATCKTDSPKTESIFDHPTFLYHDFETEQYLKALGRRHSGIAKSGLYASAVPDSNSYSLNLEIPLEKFDLEDIELANTSAWFRAEGTFLNAAFVLEIKDTITGKTIAWKGKEVIDNNVTPGKWFLVNAEHTLKPDELHAGYAVKLYVWNRCKTPLIVDDFRLSFRKNPYEKHKIRPFEKEKNKPPFPITYLKNEWTLFEDAEIQSIFNCKNMLIAGNFIENFKDEILIISTKQIQLIQFTGTEKRFRIMKLKSELEFQTTNDYFVSGKFGNSNYDNLLQIKNNGKWQLFEIKNEQIELIEKSDAPIPNWTTNSKKYVFTSNNSLTNESENLSCLALQNKSSEIVINTYLFENHEFKIISPDFSLTLPEDEFRYLKPENLIFDVQNEKRKNSYLIYNSEKRFDLKTATINEFGFTIHSQVDFKGFPKNCNPKYYETAILLTGCFNDNQVNNLLIIGLNTQKNGSEEIRNTLQVYNLE